MIHIVTDSSCDLPKNIIDEYDISVVPLNLRLGDEEFIEGINISAEEFQERMLKSKELPKTSQPSPAAFKEIFEKLADKGEVLCLTISSGLSGTYQSACIGKEMSKGNVIVFDTLAGSLGHGIQIIRAAELARMGAEMDEILKKLTEIREGMNIFILLDTLENIVKGGRLSKFQGSLAKILDLKVLLHNVDGKVEMMSKIRGRKKSIENVIREIGETGTNFSHKIFGITHVQNMEDAEYLRNVIIEKFHPKEVIINYMGATMGTYAGKGGIIISY